ncbi:MAG: S9 family peptidase [Paludibacteraceae bacterium]|nr:S9 family peptidase [Paludibacteraceae bacterium]
MNQNMNIKTFFMASLALLTLGCNRSQDTASDKAPISKPQLTLQGDRLTPEALWSMGRIGSVAADIETGLLAYTVSYYSIEENRSTTWIRICERTQTASQAEGSIQTIDEFVGSDPAWFGGSGVLAYLKGGKLYLRQGGQDIEVSSQQSEISEVEGFLLSPMRDKVVLIRPVKSHETTVDKYPDLPLATGRIVNDLMYKHWDEWVDEVPQPFIYDLDVSYVGESMQIKSATLGKSVNILDGTSFECPMRPFGGIEQLAWNPNNKELAYTCRKKTGLDYAVSTNSDIYLYDLETGKHTNVTPDNGGYDINPAYSPDGTKIAWLSMERDGYESDENRIKIASLTEDGIQTTTLTEKLDMSIDEFAWFDDASLVFTACHHALVHVYRIDLDGTTTILIEGQFDHNLGDVCDKDIYVLRHSMLQANEIFVLGTQTSDADRAQTAELPEVRQLTFENENIFSQLDRGQVIPRWQKTTDGKQMLTWIILPPHFDPNKKYPALLYCEGGPQSPVSQFWSFRWNFMMMAANDYVIIAPNRRGLPGFGKAWNEEISGDYGGQCMRDYLTAIDDACANLPYIDKDRLGCVGASFGGFSVYWLAGHHNKRFKAFIAHDGIFNLEMQYLETEEKWFANWDLGGNYWDKSNKIAQRTFANSPHKFVDKWDAPILCIHGEKDYRILANQAMAAFDAAKMRGVPAELLIFPDENHWVLKPQNGILWQRTFFEWLDKWLK